MNDNVNHARALHCVRHCESRLVSGVVTGAPLAEHLVTSILTDKKSAATRQKVNNSSDSIHSAPYTRNERTQQHNLTPKRTSSHTHQRQKDTHPLVICELCTPTGASYELTMSLTTRWSTGHTPLTPSH